MSLVSVSSDTCSATKCCSRSAEAKLAFTRDGPKQTVGELVDMQLTTTGQT